MNLLWAAVAVGMGLWLMITDGNREAAVGFFAWGAAMYNRHEIEELRKKLRSGGHDV